MWISIFRQTVVEWYKSNDSFDKVECCFDIVAVYHFVFFCVSLDHFIRVLLAFVVLGLVSSVGYHDKRMAGSKVSEMTYSVSSGT